MLSINPHDLSTAQLQAYLQCAVAPRPIAFASTINAKGQPNLSPFSFFNVFSANPPILIFSPARRVRDNSIKHTLMNVQELQEVVINVVDYAMVQQMSLASTEYAEGVNEFVKAGFTPIPSMLVKPYRVQEAPVQFECKVNQVIALGNQGGAGNLVICEVLKMHISEAILDDKGAIVQEKLDLVARLGGNWYSRANAGLFEVPKPLTTLGIGVDAIPDFVKNSGLFSGNDLGLLANIDALPSPEEVAIFVKQNFELKAVLSADEPIKQLQLALRYVQANEVESAWKVLLA
ncbi:MAG: flavin reductase family protein [Flavobacterium sp.]|jgi:flavin reductase (DIM6/NTAB) family NADH-FMN oxidoreductase RutF|nr:flavin reductase family protein [Flavobacterium sp.]